MSELDYKSLLIREYKSLVYWEPDHEEYGVQFGPSQKEIDKVVQVIKGIDPDWNTLEEDQKLEDDRRHDSIIALSKTSLEDSFPDFYENLHRLQKHESDFLEQQRGVSLEKMSNKQVRWVLILLKQNGAYQLATTLANYFSDIRNK